MSDYTKSEVFSIMNEVRAIVKANPDQIDLGRFYKAFGLLVRKNQELEYYATPKGCSCPDWEFRYARHRKDINGRYYTGACKHMIAARMIEKILERREAHDVTRILKDAGRKHDKVLFDTQGMPEKIYEPSI